MHLKQFAARCSLLSFLFLIAPFSVAETKPQESGQKEHGTEKQSFSKPFDTKNFKGIWKNQRGSYLDIAKLENNEFRGLFTTAVADTKSCIGQPVEVVGFVNGNAMSLSLSMESCGSPVTISMVGVINDRMELETYYMVQFKGEDTWKSRAFNRDVYTRQDMKSP